MQFRRISSDPQIRKALEREQAQQAPNSGIICEDGEQVALGDDNKTPVYFEGKPQSKRMLNKMTSDQYRQCMRLTYNPRAMQEPRS